jgi:hypothetical protein
MSWLGERGINVEVINQISVVSPTGVALPSVVFGSMTGTSAFINTSTINTLTCSNIYSSMTTGSSAYFTNISSSNIYTPQLTADNLTGGNAYFSTITGGNIYSSPGGGFTGNVTGSITGSNGSFSSLLQIPTSTGTAMAGSIYYSSSDNKLHCYNPTGGWISTTLS